MDSLVEKPSDNLSPLSPLILLNLLNSLEQIIWDSSS